MKTIYYGEYAHTLDEKGRIILPSKFREMLGDKCHVTRGYDGCLTVYDDEGWDKCLQRMIENLEHETDRSHRRVNRSLASGGVDVNIDKQGRMLIPASLRDYAGIDKDVSIIGQVDKIEIWNTEKWQAYINNEDDTLEDAAELVEQAKSRG